MNAQVLDDQQEPIYRSSVLTQDVAWKTCRTRWMIETYGERGLGKSVLAVRHDDDDDDDDALFESLAIIRCSYKLKHLINKPDLHGLCGNGYVTYTIAYKLCIPLRTWLLHN